MNRINNQNQESQTNRFVIFILLMTCFITNISQMSFFVDSGLSSRVSIIVWIVCFTFAFILERKVFRLPSLSVYIFSIVFFVLIAINSLFSGLDYWGSSHVYSLFISLFVFTVGCLVSRVFDEEKWNKLIIAYVISSCVVAIEVYANYFAHNFNISSRIYAYDSKNSFSQILLTSIVLLMFGMSNEYKKKYKLPRVIIITFLFILICLMKSRATIIGFGVLYAAFLINRDIKIKYKLWSIAALIIASIVLMQVPWVYNLVVNDILLAGRSLYNLNDLSSGRVNIIRSGIDQLHGNLLFGIGKKYLDCYPIATVLQFGLVAGIVLWIVALLPLIISIRMRKNQYSLYHYNFVTSMIVLSITYALNGLFECLTPLGPGVKCFFLWLALGIMTNANSSCFQGYEAQGNMA